jgi:hypothetical protein
MRGLKRVLDCTGGESSLRVQASRRSDGVDGGVTALRLDFDLNLKKGKPK